MLGDDEVKTVLTTVMMHLKDLTAHVPDDECQV
jgi:hypothetical protein